MCHNTSETLYAKKLNNISEFNRFVTTKSVFGEQPRRPGGAVRSILLVAGGGVAPAPPTPPGWAPGSSPREAYLSGAIRVIMLIGLLKYTRWNLKTFCLFFYKMLSRTVAGYDFLMEIYWK